MARRNSVARGDPEVSPQTRLRRAVALLSGGLDSTVSLALARRRGVGLKKALFLDYGQKAAARERQSARTICNKFRIPLKIINIKWLREIARTSALVNRTKKVPQVSVRCLKDRRFRSRSPSAVWVSNRNGIFINIAAAWAESLGCRYIITGFNAEEAARFPDNSSGFINAANKALKFSTLNQVKIVSYTSKMDKREIIRQGRAVKAPIHLTWSCYEGGTRPCGRCESCQRRIGAERDA